MINLKSAALFTAFGFLLASLAGSLRAAPDQTLGMALMSATVDQNGTLVRGSGAVSAHTTGNPGDYVVRFDRDVRDCTYVASVGSPTSPVAWTANVVANAPGTGSGPDTVRMATSNGGTFANYPFHLMVFCPK